MANKLSKDISGSVQEKRGMLYLVVSYKDTVTQKNKTKWLGLGLPAGSTKSRINKAVREAKNKFESEYKRFLDGYDCGCYHHFCSQFHEKPYRNPRSGDASDEEGKSVV